MTWHIAHTWSKWVDRESQRSMSEMEMAKMGTGKLVGDLVITQERRCTICNRLQLRQVNSAHSF